MKNSCNNEIISKPLIFIIEDDVDYSELIIQYFFKSRLYSIGACTIKKIMKILTKKPSMLTS